MTTEPSGTRTFGARLRWVVLTVPAFSLGWAFAQVMGEVLGEAWGGDFLHLAGHSIGTVAVVALVCLAGWLALQGRAPWASRWATAATIGSIVGLALYLPILALAPDALAGLTIALTLHLPLTMAATLQARALRGRVRRPRQWALAWFIGVLEVDQSRGVHSLRPRRFGRRCRATERRTRGHTGGPWPTAGVTGTMSG